MKMKGIDIKGLINQVKNLLMKPKDALAEARDVRPAMKDLIVYLAIVAVPTLIGILVGYGLVGYGTFRVYARMPIGWAVGWALSRYIFSIIGIIIFAYIVNALASSFSSKKDQIQATKLAVYTATPWLVAGILFIFPPISFLVLLAGLYGVYIMYLGLPVLMGTPEDKKIVYLIVSIIVFIVIMWVVGQVSMAVMQSAMGVGYHFAFY